jgi:hypothetical protein
MNENFDLLPEENNLDNTDSDPIEGPKPKRTTSVSQSNPTVPAGMVAKPEQDSKQAIAPGATYKGKPAVVAPEIVKEEPTPADVFAEADQKPEGEEFTPEKIKQWEEKSVKNFKSRIVGEWNPLAAGYVNYIDPDLSPAEQNQKLKERKIVTDFKPGDIVKGTDADGGTVWYKFDTGGKWNRTLMPTTNLYPAPMDPVVVEAMPHQKLQAMANKLAYEREWTPEVARQFHFMDPSGKIQSELLKPENQDLLDTFEKKYSLGKYRPKTGGTTDGLVGTILDPKAQNNAGLPEALQTTAGLRKALVESVADAGKINKSPWVNADGSLMSGDDIKQFEYAIRTLSNPEVNRDLVDKQKKVKELEGDVQLLLARRPQAAEAKNLELTITDLKDQLDYLRQNAKPQSQSDINAFRVTELGLIKDINRKVADWKELTAANPEAKKFSMAFGELANRYKGAYEEYRKVADKVKPLMDYLKTPDNDKRLQLIDKQQRALNTINHIESFFPEQTDAEIAIEKQRKAPMNPVQQFLFSMTASTINMLGGIGKTLMDPFYSGESKFWATKNFDDFQNREIPKKLTTPDAGGVQGVINAVGNVLPSIIITGATGGTGRLLEGAAIGASSYQSAHNQALGQGYTGAGAHVYATFIGGLEVVSEELFHDNIFHGFVPSRTAIALGLKGDRQAMTRQLLTEVKAYMKKLPRETLRETGEQTLEEVFVDVATPLWNGLVNEKEGTNFNASAPTLGNELQTAGAMLFTTAFMKGHVTARSVAPSLSEGSRDLLLYKAAAGDIGFSLHTIDELKKAPGADMKYLSELENDILELRTATKMPPSASPSQKVQLFKLQKQVRVLQAEMPNTEPVFQPAIKASIEGLQKKMQQVVASPGAAQSELQKSIDPVLQGIDDTARELGVGQPEPSLETVLPENKTAATQGFFSDVVTGKSEKFKPKKPFTPILSFSRAEQAFQKVYDKFKGAFDEHIATSIPTFRETQVKVGTALTKMFGKKGGLVYDIGGSEGGFVKAITEATGGKVKSINLDVNEDMKASHEKAPVAGADFVNEAFLEPYTDEQTGKTYPRHQPTQKADVVHESMVFQFISPEREQFIGEVADNYLKDDGILLLEEKVVPDSEAEWKANEERKDQYKLQHYSAEELNQKKEEVLVGMKKNQTAQRDLLKALSGKFKHVAEYWDSGNFKGYVASNSKQKIDEFMGHLGGRISSVYSSERRERSKVFTAQNADQARKEAKKFKGAQARIIRQTSGVLKALKSVAPNLSITLHYSPNSYLEAVKKEGGRDSDADTAGFYLDQKGHIHINLSDVERNTLLHEGSHPLIDMIASRDDKFVDEAYSELEKLPAAAPYIEFGKLYPAAQAKKEALVEFLADVADGKVALNNNVYTAVRNLVARILKAFGVDISQIVVGLDKNSELRSVAKAFAKSVASGKELQLRKLNREKMESLSVPINQNSAENMAAKRNTLQFQQKNENTDLFSSGEELNPSRLRPLTLGIFEAFDDFKRMKGKTVKVETIKNQLNRQGVKAIEKEMILETLDQEEFKGKKEIPFDQFRDQVEAQIMPLERINTSSYASYGMDSLGKDDKQYGESVTVIYNAPIEHGQHGHFHSDFMGRKLSDVQWEVREMQGKFVALQKDHPTLTQENVMNYVGTVADSSEKVEQWLKEQEERKGQTEINVGLFGHVRLWKDGKSGTWHIAELQSDYFQKNNAKRDLVQIDEDELNKIASNEYADKKLDGLLSYISEHLGAETRIKYEAPLDPAAKGFYQVSFIDKDKGFVLYYNSDAMRISDRYNDNANKFRAVVSTLKELSWSPPSTNHLSKEIAQVQGAFNELATSLYRTEKASFDKYKDELQKKLQAEVKLDLTTRQFIASQKQHELRILRETIKDAARNSVEQLRFPTPKTLAVIEGYISDNGNMPYEIRAASDYDYLSAGDRIDYGGEDYTVVESNGDEITVVKSDKVHQVSLSEEIEYRTDDDYSELNSELEREFGPGPLTEEQLEGWSPDSWAGEELKTDMQSAIADKLHENSPDWFAYFGAVNGKSLINGELNPNDFYQIRDARREQLQSTVFRLERDPYATAETQDTIDTMNKAIEQLKDLTLEKANEYIKERKATTVDYNDYLEDAKENIERSYENQSIDDVLGYYNSWDSGDGDIYYVTESRVHEISLQQPAEYKSDSEDENWEEELNDDQKTVVNKYKELNQLIKKERKGAETISDDNGREWLQFPVTGQDHNSPVLAFQKKKRRLTEPEVDTQKASLRNLLSNGLTPKQLVERLQGTQGMDKKTAGRLVEDVQKNLKTDYPVEVSRPTIKGIIKENTDTKVTDTVTMNELDLLKKQMKDELRGFKSGVRDVREKMRDLQKVKDFIGNQLVEILDRAAKRGALDTRVPAKLAATIMKRIQRASTPVQLIAAINRVDKFIQDTDYSRKLSEAKGLQKDIKKLSRSKTPFTRAVNNLTMVKDFLSLNPSEVEDIDEYRNVATALRSNLQGLRVKVQEGVPSSKNEDYQISNRQLQEYMDEQLSHINEQKRQDLADAYRDLVDAGIIDPKGMSLEDMTFVIDQMQFGSDSDVDQADLAWSIQQEKLRYARELISYRMEALQDYGFDHLSQGTLSGEEEGVLKSLLKINPEELSIKQLVQFNDNINNILYNGNFAATGNMALLSKVRENIKELAAKEQATGLKLGSVTEKWKEAFSSKNQLFEWIARSSKLAAELQRLSGISGISAGHARAKMGSAKTIKAYNDMKKSFGPDMNSPLNRFKRGVYAFVIQHYGGTAEEQQAEFARQVGLVKQTADMLASSDDKAEKTEGELLQQVYNELLGGATSAGEVDQKIDPKNKALVKFWQDAFSEIKDPLREQALIYNNQETDDTVNYTSVRYKAFGSAEPSENRDIFEANFNRTNLDNTPAGTKIKRLRMNTLGRSVVNFDFDRVQSGRYYESVYDIEASKSINEARLFFNSPEAAELLGGVNNAKVVRRQMAAMVNVQRQKRFNSDDATAQALNSILNHLQAKGVRIALGSITQPFKQYPSVWLGALVNLGGDMDLLFKAFMVPTDHAIYSHYNIGERGSVGGGFVHNIDFEAIKPADLSEGGVKLWHKVQALSEKLTGAIMTPLVYADVKVARRTWLAYYMQDLRRRGQLSSMDLGRPDDEAAAYAEQMVSRTQNANDTSSLPEFFQSNGNAKIVKNLLAAFSSFSTNMRVRMTQDMDKFANGNKKEAVLSITAALAEQAAFNAIKVAIGMGVNYGFHKIAPLLGLLDDKDREKEDDYERINIHLGDHTLTTNKDVKKWAANTMSDFFFSGLGTLSQDVLQHGMNIIYSAAVDESYPNSKEPDNRTERPDLFWSPDEASQTRYRMLGTYGIMGGLVQSLVDNAPEALAGSTTAYSSGGMEYKSKTHAEKITPEEQRAALVTWLIDLFAVAGVSEQLVSAVNQKLKSQLKKKLEKKYGGAKTETLSKEKNPKGSSEKGSGSEINL